MSTSSPGSLADRVSKLEDLVAALQGSEANVPNYVQIAPDGTTSIAFDNATFNNATINTATINNETVVGSNITNLTTTNVNATDVEIQELLMPAWTGNGFVNNTPSMLEWLRVSDGAMVAYLTGGAADTAPSSVNRTAQLVGVAQQQSGNTGAQAGWQANATGLRAIIQAYASAQSAQSEVRAFADTGFSTGVAVINSANQSSFLRTATVAPTTDEIAYGTVALTFAASTISNVVSISPGLLAGTTPKAVLLNAHDTGNLNIVPVAQWSAGVGSQFFVAALNPSPLTATINFSWLAVG